MRQLASVIAIGVFAPSLAFGQSLDIDHEPATCVVAEKFPQLQARVPPATEVAGARVMFQSETGTGWYAVSMKAEGAVLHGVLPKPQKTLKAFRYYIEVTDKALAISRTKEFTSRVASGAAECGTETMAGALASASVIVQVPSGASVLVPAGFASAGVVPGASAAAATAGGAATTGGGGGIPALVVIGGVGAAGAAVAGVAIATATGKVEMHGQVFATGSYQNPVGPVSGASVSTSLDGATAVTDGNGQFHLFTQTARTEDDCRSFTVTIVAAGNPTYSVTGNWGDGWGDSGGQNLPHPFILSPPSPTANMIIKPNCP